MSARTDVLGHVHRSSFVVVAHGVENGLGIDFGAGFHPEGHPVGHVVSHCIVRVLIHVVRYGAEERPHAGIASAHRAEIGRSVGIAEAELLVRAVEIALFTGEGDHVGSVEAVLGIVERESRDARLVGVCRNVSVGNAASYPDDALAGVVTLGIELAALADQLHDPGFVLVGDREGFAARSVAVGVGQIHDDPDRFAGSLGALQGDVDERAVIDATRRIGQLLASAVGRFGDDERMFVHVADRGVCLCRLRNFSQVAARVPVIDREHRAGFVAPGEGFVECAVELVGVGGVGDHHRAVRGGSPGDDEVGAGVCRLECQTAQGCGKQGSE